MSISPSRTAASSCARSGKLRQLSSTFSALASNFINSTLAPDKLLQAPVVLRVRRLQHQADPQFIVLRQPLLLARRQLRDVRGGAGAAQPIKGSHNQPITHRQQNRFIEVSYTDKF